MSKQADRSKMVREAERLIREELSGGQRSHLSATQLSQLVNVCQQAKVPEEIELYLKYQGGRRSAGMSMGFVTNTLKATKTLFGEQGDLADWRYFAVFLKRSFVYENAVQNQGRGGH